MDKETRELLAWYVNGTLAGADRDRVEEALRNEVGASSQLAWERSVQGAVKNDATFEIAPERGLYQTMQRIRADVKAKAPVGPARGSWFARVSERFHWSPALALACGVVAVQFAVIAQMWPGMNPDADYSGVRNMGTRPMTSDAFIRVSFKPESTESELSALLRTIGAEVVAGPSQLGDYYLLLRKPAAMNALTALQGSANVESAEIVNALPARP